MLTAVAVVVGLAAASVVAYIVERRSRTSPSTFTGTVVPQLVDRSDFDEPRAPWLIAVFTSDSCNACAEVLARARSAASDDVVIHEIEFVRDRLLHEKYDVDAVPMTLLVDRTGAAAASWLGPLNLDELHTAIDDG